MRNFLFLVFILMITITPVFAQSETNLEVNLTQNETKKIVEIISNDEVEFIQTESENNIDYAIDENGTVYLNFTINNFVELEKEFEECEINECEILLRLLEIFKEFVKEEKSFENRILDYMTIVVPSAMVIIGILVTRLLTEQSRVKSLNEEIKKIQLYINSDFATVKRIVFEQKTELNDIAEKLNTSNYISKITEELILLKEASDSETLNADEINTLIEDSSEYKDLIKSLKLRLKFTFWNMLENGSSILKLKEDEVKILETSHHLMDTYRQMDEKNWLKFTENVNKIVRNSTSENLQNSLKIHFSLRTKELLGILDVVTKHLEFVSTISWTDLSQEILTPKVSELIQNEK